MKGHKMETTTLSTLQKPAPMPENVKLDFQTVQGFEAIQRLAKGLAASTLVPASYQNNIPNCLIALELAYRIGVSHMMVMQSMNVIHGRPAWSSQFLIATFNACGRYSSLRYEWFGEEDTDDWGCRAWTIEKSTGEKLVGAKVNIAIAKSEGWYSKNGSKWKTMPQQMLMYRAASWFVRAYAPELSMGLYCKEEIEDGFEDQPQNLTVTLSNLEAQHEQKQEEVTKKPRVKKEAPPEIEQKQEVIPEVEAVPIASPYLNQPDHIQPTLLTS
jgi:hypothetical protein